MGPLTGIKIIEIAGIGPGPFAAMMLSDMGAEVVRIDRVDGAGAGMGRADLLNRGRRSLAVNLKSSDGVQLVLGLLEKADGLIEGFRPGVLERLGLGPDVCLERNPRLVYGRMTGWGQEGPLATAAGHDINYIALAGVLHGIGQAGQKPVPPLNLVGDFGGGGLLLAFGVLCALLEAGRSGKGQVVDAAMVDGAALLMTMMHGFLAMGLWRDERGVNLLDGGAPFYDTYETQDGGYVAIGPIEPQFYTEFLQRLGLAAESLPAQLDREQWPAMKERLAAVFKTKTRAEWCSLLEGTDTCFAPVLSMKESRAHPHMKQRGTFIDIDGVPQPAPAPRFSRTSPRVPLPPSRPGQQTRAVLEDWGVSEGEIVDLLARGVVTQS